MKRVVLDQGLAPRAAAILREYGFDAIHVSDIGMSRSDDVEILELAATESRVCITLDHDFHAHLATSRQGQPSVVLLRTENLNAQGQADLILAIYLQCEEALVKGAAVSADRATIRVRRLPLR